MFMKMCKRELKIELTQHLPFQALRTSQVMKKYINNNSRDQKLVIRIIIRKLKSG